MTLQEVFDKVWDHFVVNGGPPSVDEKGKCLYRGPSGAKCAYGLFIPDDKYQPEMEGRAAWFIERRDCFVGGSHVGVLDLLQSCHDEAAVKQDSGCRAIGTFSGPEFTARIRERLEEFAADHALAIPASVE